MFLRVKRNVNFTILNLRGLCLLNHIFYRNFSHIFLITFGLFFISKKLRRKRILIRLFNNEKICHDFKILNLAGLARKTSF